MVSRVDPILGMPLNSHGQDQDQDQDDAISFSQVESMPSPYLHYGIDQGGEGGGGGGGGGAGGGGDKGGKKGSKGGRERPRSAARRDDGESKSSRK